MQSGVYREAVNCQVYQAGLNTHLNVGSHLTMNTRPRVPLYLSSAQNSLQPPKEDAEVTAQKKI